MRTYLTHSLVLAVLAGSLTACAGASADYPSLAMRPIESGVVPETSVPPAAIRPATPAARLAELRQTAASADAAFSARAGEAERLARAAAGQPFESNARAAAMVALAELDARRGATAGALAGLDSLAADSAASLSPDPALSTAQAEVVAILAREDRAIASLWEVMGS